MSHSLLADEAGLPLDELRRIDGTCDRFEEAWRSGEPPDLATFLDGFSGAARSRLFRELLAFDVEFLDARGERPAAEAYHGRFPDLAAVVDSVFAGAPSPSSGGLSRAIAERNTEFGSGLVRAELGPASLEALRADGYELLGELGRGGMGVVYLARKVALDRLCALKMILAGAHAGAAASARFRAEAGMVARLRHPGIVQIFHVGEAEGLPYLELEYLRGGSLDKASPGVPRPPAEAAGLLAALARAIAEAHRQGIIHRDLKPANILLDAGGQPKVADFGLAKALDSDDGLTKTHAVLGSPSYMAPEQAEGGSRRVGPPTDVYALGAILYEMLTGRPPFRASTALETLAQVRWDEPVPPSRLHPGLPRDLETVCLKCLEKAPSRRYATADALAEDLRRYLAGEPILARPVPAWERAWKWARRRPAVASAAGLGAVAALLLMAGAVHYNARLRDAAARARAAERSALEQRNLAFSAFNRLIYDVQERLGSSPATRPLRRDLLDTAIGGLEEIARHAEASAPDLSRAIAHQKLGDIYAQIGRSAEARRQYGLSQSLATALADARPRDLGAKECLARTFSALGNLDIRAHRYAEARAECLAAVDLTAAVSAREPARPGARRGLTEAYIQLGRAFGFEQNWPEALAWLGKAHDLAEGWAAAEPASTEAKELLAWSCRKLADIRKLSGDPGTSRDDYRRAIALGRELVEAEPGKPEFLRHLGVALHDLAGVEHRLGDRAGARAHYEEARRLFGRRAESDPEDLEAQTFLYFAERDLGRLERDEGHPGEAAVLLRRALDRVVALDRAGRLEERPDFRTREIPATRKDLAECEAAAGPDNRR